MDYDCAPLTNENQKADFKKILKILLTFCRQVCYSVHWRQICNTYYEQEHRYLRDPFKVFRRLYP